MDSSSRSRSPKDIDLEAVATATLPVVVGGGRGGGAAEAHPPKDMGKAIEGTKLRIGDVVDGKYRIDRVLGIGGMGIVLAATHLLLRQRVAIKLLLPTSLEIPVVVARFEREARAAATLRSDHVAKVVDVGKLPECGPYMVLEFLEGSDLEDVAEREGPLPCDTAVNYVLQACEAIAEAHRLGIIHRDLKPQNLFLSKRLDGSPLVKVLDFGISKMGDELTLTKTRDVMGSPLFMAPEQLKGVRDVDERADIWALGAILFRLITGRTPFDGETFAQLCSRVLMDPPRSVRRLRPEIPEGLASVIERCLVKDPAGRLPTVALLAEALDPFASHRSVRAAHRVMAQAASNHPPPLAPAAPYTERLVGGPANVITSPSSGSNAAVTPTSLPPLSSSQAVQNASSSASSTTERRRSRSAAPLVALVALLALAVGSYGVWHYRARLVKAEVSSAPTPPPSTTAITLPPSASASAIPSAVASSTVLAEPSSSVAIAPSSSSAPSSSIAGRAQQTAKKPPIIVRKPNAPDNKPKDPPPDDAPDLRK